MKLHYLAIVGCALAAVTVWIVRQPADVEKAPQEPALSVRLVDPPLEAKSGAVVAERLKTVEFVYELLNRGATPLRGLLARYS